MKAKFFFLLVTTSILISCEDKSPEIVPKKPNVETVDFLPFQNVPLQDLEFFQATNNNWSVVGNVFVDRSKEKSIAITAGKGILVNIPDPDNRGNLFSKMDHGDIELEFDVMMPKGSNSGLYFQGRYEVQLFDSWGVQEQQHSDMGGIYQRWDTIRGNGQEGFDGTAPLMNTAKSPGLWQHLRILFHAPKFDASKNKTKNARFEKVWLNNVLIHENVEISGPTRGAAHNDEIPLGPLLIQGDHGPVAIKNIKYKLYNNQQVFFTGVKMVEYENKEELLPNLDSLVPLREIAIDSLSANMVSGVRTQRILEYSGDLQIPVEGEYLFDFKVDQGGGRLIVDQDTLVDFNGNYNLDSLGLGKISLQKGTVPFTLIYNKHNPWVKGFTLEVEGPGVQKHELQAPNSLDLSRGKPAQNIMVNALEEAVVQRSFFMHNGVKRTHCISVGTPQSIHYAYDLELGSLLKVWSGDFLDATPMWHGRGQSQLALPAGFTVTCHGTPEFTILKNEDSIWPESVVENVDWKHLGYEFNEMGIPVFLSQIGSSTIKDKMIPSQTLRILNRTIKVNGNQVIWHKVAAGESIEKLPDGTYIINDESYFIDFSERDNLIPIVRTSDGIYELLVKVPAGDHLLEYSITW